MAEARGELLRDCAMAVGLGVVLGLLLITSPDEETLPALLGGVFLATILVLAAGRYRGPVRNSRY